jgi:hypothetical protein
MEIVKDSMLIGYVCGDNLDREFMPSVIRAMSHDSDVEHGGRRQILGLINKKGTDVTNNRNALVPDFLSTPAEYLFSLDTDVNVHPTAPYLLFDAAKQNDAPIMSGLYFSFLSTGALLPTWFENDDEKGNGNVKFVEQVNHGEVKPLAGVGMGCALIHRSVFEAFLKVPKWASDSWTWFGRDQYGPPEATAHMGEDICFCRRAASLGFQTWGNAAVEAKHAKRWEIGFEEFVMCYQANYRGVRGNT